MVEQGGARANRAGRRLENFASDILDEQGYQLVSANEFFAMCKLEQPIYARQCKTGKDIYGKQKRVDLILYHPTLHAECLVIQCKWQAAAGSVEQKYPFEVLNIQQDRYDTIIILDGGGYSDGAKQWLIDQVGKGKLKAVVSQGEFQNMAGRGQF